MEKVIVVVFDDEAKAHQGSNQLKQLHQSTDLTLYAAAVIAKDASGKVGVLQTVDEKPIDTLIGTALGGMVGLLGRPASVAEGLSGALAGALSDISRMGVHLKFLNDVAAVLTPKKVAVVASVDEEWTTPLDSAIKPLGGILFRKPGNEVIDDLIEREIQKTGIELKALQAEFNSATTEQQAQLQAKIDTTHQTLQAQIDAADKWVVETSERVDTKIKAMQEQVTKASENKQAEMEQHIRKIKTDIGVCQLINDG